MRQRVMIAMALALEPRIVILDEPTTALDVVTQREILEELIALRERLGFAVLFITHDLSLLVEIADSIAVMYAGRLVERAAAADLFRAPRHPYTLGLLSSFPPLHGPHRHMTGIPGSPPDLRVLPVGCVFHPRCRYAMDRCRDAVPAAGPPAGGAAAAPGWPRAGCRTASTRSRPSWRCPSQAARASSAPLCRTPVPATPASPPPPPPLAKQPRPSPGAWHDRDRHRTARPGDRRSRCSKRAG